MLPHLPQDMPLWQLPHIRPHPTLLLNILKLPLHPQDMPTALLTAVPTHLSLSGTYHPHAHIVPSQHSSNATLIPV
ncbi:hypothetical protein O181_093009 [Austropuccinia psidii MF-1]|uniref:Uncharacterized protein n=1 Tax=Austropuccinia psidii MF-1 TaxID=1389203 RepID=A0A9Q3P9G2_9BASI|nr:hypothetical protein [Austropuccinia psidii MF-1]